MKPDSIIKGIVDAVKAKKELSGVSCVYAYSREFSQNPVCAFTLCLGVGKTRFEKNPDSASPLFCTEINLCLLAPSGAGGKRLSEVSMWISEAIRESLSVNSIEVESPKFNSTNSTLFADIKVVVEDTSLAEAVCGLYIDGTKEQGLILFEIESDDNLEKEGKLLSGYSFAETGKTGFTIKLKTARLLKTRADEFELRLDYDGFCEEYRSCRVNKITRGLSQWGSLSFTYDIKAKSMELFEKEVQDD